MTLPLAAILALWPAPRAGAWGTDGHQAVALIAQKRLEPAAAAGVRELLGDGVGLDKVASCADRVRDSKASVPCAGFTLPYAGNTSGWHVLAAPLSESPAGVDIDRYCRPGDDCPTLQVRRRLAILRDRGASQADRQIALAFVVHLVGDLHQPLHCAADRADGPFRKRFGNTKRVTFDGKTMNLHHLWDELIEDGRASYGGPAALAEKLNAEITAEQAAEWSRGDLVHGAALESFAIAKETIYPQYARDGGRDLGRSYKDAMQPIVRRRLEQAGVRLAALLNEAFAGSAVGPTPR